MTEKSPIVLYVFVGIVAGSLFAIALHLSRIENALNVIAGIAP